MRAPCCLAFAVVLVGCQMAEIGGDDGGEDPIGEEEAAACGGFADVAGSAYYCGAVGRIRQAGITSGCNPPANDRFCPDEVVTREQMATFLVRALDLPAASYPCGLVDVAATNVHRFNICAIKRAGITVGCNPPANDRFCPSAELTRGHMAAFLTRALDLPTCTLSNYTDVPAAHVFAGSICAVWKAGISVSYQHPDPVNDRYNNTYGPDAAMRRRDMAVFLDRAVLQAPAAPHLATITSDYQAVMSDGMSYVFSSDLGKRAGEVQALVYLYRAARKVQNPPAGFSLSALEAKIIQGADQLAALYRTNCIAGHDGDGTSTFGCARLALSSTDENLDSGSDRVIALLETIRLLFEIGGANQIAKGKSYWPAALHTVAHANDEHRLTSPCTGWEVEALTGASDGMLKWNKSNRWAIANYLVYDIRARWNGHVGGDGTSYRTWARAALTCFRDDLRNAGKYRCGGARCYDSPRGPWWTGWHSAYGSKPYSSNEDDAGHASATAEIVFHAIHDRWDVLGYYDLQQFARHFEERRLASTTVVRGDGGIGRLFLIAQYPDSDSYPGSTCAMGVSCTATSSDWDSRKTGGWLRIAAVYGKNGFRVPIRNLEPTWSDLGAANYVGLTVGAFALFGEVGAPRRLGY